MGNYDFELDLETENTMSIIDRWITPGTKILEFGPANGRLTKYLKQSKNCSITIVELDPVSGNEASEWAQKSYIGEKLGDIENYYWADSSERYDFIIFADVLEHLRNPDAVLRRCAGVLADNGSILLSVPNLGHNSVVISIMNDHFTYADTGLLDRTHVHFFTYHSLVQMIESSGYDIEQIIPVYSRVGDNEIPVTYSDVPMRVEKYLRTRPSGSVYQFVCKIGKNCIKKNWDVFDSPMLQECHNWTEAQLFYVLDGQKDFCANQAIGKIVSTDQEIDITFDLQPGVRRIRFDPLDNTSVILLKEAEMITAAGHKIPCKIKNSSANFSVNNLFFFSEQDPQIVFKRLPRTKDVVKIRVAYHILSDSESTSHYQTIASILEKEIHKHNKSRLRQKVKKIAATILRYMKGNVLQKH